METNLQGRIRNLSLPKKNGLIPLFEAVVNSIHAIEEKSLESNSNPSLGKIRVRIIRSSEQDEFDLTPGRRAEKAIRGFEVIDDGIGFTENNWGSFNQLDHTLKVEKGCRGVGRLTWLKAFQEVRVRSIFSDGEQLRKRKFTFSADREIDGGKKPTLADKTSETETVVALHGFRQKYAQSVEKTADAIALRLLEHTLWYFVRSGGVPSIIIEDENSDNDIDLNDLFDQHMRAESAHKTFEVKGEKFDVTHVKFRLPADRKHVIAYCAGHRLVIEEAIQNVSGLTASVADDEGPFRYAGYIVSEFLDQRVYGERTGFDIEDEVHGLFVETEISRQDIREAAEPLIIDFLGDALDSNIARGKARLTEFVTGKAPQYLPIVKAMEAEKLFVDPSTPDAQLDKVLHSAKYKIEQTLLEEGSRLLQPDLSDSVESYTQRVSQYLEKLQTIKQSDLASYVTHRRVVLDFLKSALSSREDGSFEREEVVHNLIMPMGTTSEDFAYMRGSNLWLVNERLAFHQHYLGSDKSLSSNTSTGAKGGKEPDIAALNLYDNPHIFSDTDNPPQATITIVELKKPMKGGYSAGEDKDPIEQAIGYLRRIRSGGVLSKTGRPLANAGELPGYIYVLADLTKSMRERCEYATLNEAPDGLSYFGWNGSKNIKAYIEVIDFDGLLGAATQRNAAFFETLGLPTGR